MVCVPAMGSSITNCTVTHRTVQARPWGRHPCRSRFTKFRWGAIAKSAALRLGRLGGDYLGRLRYEGVRQGDGILRYVNRKLVSRPDRYDVVFLGSGAFRGM